MRDRLQVRRHANEFGRWLEAFCPPPAHLAHLVEGLWAADGEVNYARERILPRGVVDLLINLGPPYKLLERDDPTRGIDFVDAWVSGVQQRYLVVESGGEAQMMGIRLRPIGAFVFFGMPMHEISDRVVNLDLVLGREVLDLRQRLLETADLIERFRVLEQLVERRLERGPEVHRGVAWALDEIARHDGAVRLGELARELAVSHRYLIEKFRTHVGVPPKVLARILRFNRAVSWLKQRDTVNLADLALACGYYDQAHFNRDFRSFAGVSPGQFLRHRGPDGDSVLVD